MRVSLILVVVAAGLTNLGAGRVFAQPAPARPAQAAPGPPPPTLPETIARDDQGRAPVRAVRVTSGRPIQALILKVNRFLRF